MLGKYIIVVSCYAHVARGHANSMSRNQVPGALLVDLCLENISSSCHAMHILHVDTQSRCSSGFVVVL